MISEKSQEILTAQFNTLPEEIQDTILESNWKEVIRAITEKYALHIDQGGALETIVFLTMLGMEEPADFISNLKSEVRITQSLAQAITDEVEKGVFQKIRQGVMERKNNPKPITPTEEGVDIIEEGAPARDAYREDVGADTATQSKYVDGQHLDEKTLLEEIEDPQSAADTNHVDLEIPKEVFNTSGVEVIDADKAAPEATLAEGQEALNDILGQKNGSAPLQSAPDEKVQEQQEANPLSIRTLKSDILRQKLANPSWSPEIDKGMTKNTKDIIESAKEATPAPKADPYREAM